MSRNVINIVQPCS